MEAVRSSKTSVFMYLTARRHIPDDSKYHSYNCHNLKYHRWQQQIWISDSFLYSIYLSSQNLRYEITGNYNKTVNTLNMVAMGHSEM